MVTNIDILIVLLTVCVPIGARNVNFFNRLKIKTLIWLAVYGPCAPSLPSLRPWGHEPIGPNIWQMAYHERGDEEERWNV